MSQRYYWLKLNENFFEREEIKLIKQMPNGKDYIIFYMELLLRSIKTEGRLRFRDIMPYSPDMLATITNTNVDIVKSAIDVFRKLHLMEIIEDGTIFMAEVNSMIGSETKHAVKKRKYREKMALLEKIEDIVPVVSQNCPREIDTELELDKDKEIDKKEIYKEKNPIDPVINQVQEIFEHWKLVMNHPNAKLDQRRISYIKNNLINYSLNDLKSAIDGCKLSDWHMGNNNNGKQYNSVHQIFRDNDHIDHFIDIYQHSGEINERKQQFNQQHTYKSKQQLDAEKGDAVANRVKEILIKRRARGEC